MTRGPQNPLQEGQELIGILDTDDLLDDEDESGPFEGTTALGVQMEDLPVAPWDQLIAAVDREFLPLEAASPWVVPRFRAR